MASHLQATFFFSVISLAATMLTAQAHAAEIHVSPAAAADGTGSPQSPVTLHKAAQIARAGDIVILAGGVYEVSEPIIPAQSGTADAPIVYRAAYGQKPIIDGLAFIRTADGQYPSRRNMGIFHIDGKQHLRLEFLHVRNARYVNFMITGDTSNGIELHGCRAENSYGPGICLWRGQNLKVIGCEITGANDQEMRVPGQRTGSEAPHEALSLMQVKHVEIAYNRVHKCHKEGIDVKETASHVKVHHNEVYDLPRQGIYVDCWFGHLQDVEIYANAVHDCEWGIVVSAEGKDASMSDIRIHHNVVYANRASGIFFGRWGNDGPRERIDIYNNTVYANGSPDHWAGDVGGIDVRALSLKDVRIVSNIVYGNYGYEIATFAEPAAREAELASRNIVISGNLTGPMKSPAQPRGGMFNPPYAFEGIDTVVGDPMFVMWKAADFRLKDGSPALGTARAFAGIQGSKDIGCAQRK
jgi:hypothetical protein